MRNITLIQQPDGISCGNTCIKMLLEYIGIGYDMTIEDIVDICGTNNLHGTRDIEMIKGLDYFKIPYKRNNTQGDDLIQLSYLNDVLKINNIFFLRTLTMGIKHWVIVTGENNGTYYVNDPWLGLKYYTADDIIKIWKPRDFDGFEIYMDKV